MRTTWPATIIRSLDQAPHLQVWCTRSIALGCSSGNQAGRSYRTEQWWCVWVRTFGGSVPSTVNGLTPPPAGTPHYFTALGTDALHVFAFHVDWASPASSTFTELPGSPVAVAPFDSRVPSGQTGPIEQPPPADS